MLLPCSKFIARNVIDGAEAAYTRKDLDGVTDICSFRHLLWEMHT
jgi:hypothetical protein